MTGPQSLQFVEHLRQAGHLRSMEAAGRAEGSAADQGDAARGPNAPQGARENALGKLWELTDLSANEFADEAARFYDCERVTLQQLLATLQQSFRLDRAIRRPS